MQGLPPPASGDSIQTQSFRGVAIQSIVSVVTFLLAGIRIVILMRLLPPEAFGQYAYAAFAFAIIHQLAIFGLDSTFLQREAFDQREQSTHAFLRISFAIAFALIGSIFCLAIWMPAAGYLPIEASVLIGLLWINVVEAFYATTSNILRKSMQYRTLALINLVSSLAMTLISPFAAWLGFGVWSLVFEQAIAHLSRWIGLIRFGVPWRTMSCTLWREYLDAGRHILGTQLLDTLLDRFDDFWTGTFLGTTSLGLYSRAYELAQYPERFILSQVNQIYAATYASTQRNPDELSKAIEISLGIIFRLSAWATLAIIAASPGIILVLFGEQWREVIAILQWMTVYIVLNPLYGNLSTLLVHTGLANRLVRIRIVQFVFFAACLFALGQWFGVIGVAVSANLMMIFGICAIMVAMRKTTQVKFRKVFLFPSVAIGLTIPAVIFILTAPLFAAPLTNLLIGFLGTTLVYWGGLVLFDREQLGNYLAIIRQLFGQRLRSMETQP